MATNKKNRQSVAALLSAQRSDKTLLAKNVELLHHCENDWCSMQDIRTENERNERYKNGGQWEDYVTDPDNPNRKIREDVLISRGGKTPLKNNFLQQYVRNVHGQALSNPVQPIVVARSSDDQNYSEMLTNTIQANLELNESSTLGINAVEGFLTSGYAIAKVRYGHWNTKNRTDGKIDYVDINRVFWNQDAEDPRWTDLRRVGEIHDLTLDELVRNYARSRDDEKELRELYDSWANELNNREKAGESLRKLNFYNSGTSGKCRVYEVWQQRGRWVTYAHDYLTGEEIYYHDRSMREIEEINRQRIEQAAMAGIPASKVRQIYAEETFERYWYVQFLTPQGYSILEMETPYEHQEHPYVIGSMPKINGIVKPVFNDLVDMQRQVNRLITLIDFIIGSSAKGLLMVPEECLGNQSLEEFAHQYTKANGVVLIKQNTAGVMPQQISNNATNVGAWEFLNFYLQQITQISGLSGALQGQISSGNKSGVLYAQEAQNSMINFTLLFERYNNFMSKMSEKLLKVLMQYYTTPRYVDINGRAVQETAKYYEPSVRKYIVDFNMVVSNTTDTPVFRQIQDNLLTDLLKNGLITIDMFLENTSMPFAKRLKEQIKSMQEQQQVDGMQLAELQEQAALRANPQAVQMMQQMVAA